MVYNPKVRAAFPHQPSSQFHLENFQDPLPEGPLSPSFLEENFPLDTSLLPFPASILPGWGLGLVAA